MAYRTLTNPKILLSLGPNRSILGTLIRPDSKLVERLRGGSNRQVTFDSLLPGSGEPLESRYDQQDGLLGNWSLGYEDPLPRGDRNPNGGGVSGHSSEKKRKASRERSVKKRLRQYADGKRFCHKKKDDGRKVRNDEKHEKSQRDFH